MHTSPPPQSPRRSGGQPAAPGRVGRPGWLGRVGQPGRVEQAKRVGRVATGVLAGALTLAACGGSTPTQSGSTTTSTSSGAAPSTSSRSTPATTGGAKGTANVAYAGSLEYLNETVVGPAFHRATGNAYEGRGGGSFGLSKEILAGEITPNVFESLGAAPIAPLVPRYTTWWVRFAASPIVVAYNPSTRFAPELRAIAAGKRPLADLFRLFESPGFLLGRTNPNTDPQGQAFVEMVQLAERQLHLPSGAAARILGSLDNPAQVFAETALEARLEAGQLDAASAFRSQAIQLHLPYVSLPASLNFGEPSEAATYASASLRLSDGTVVHGSPLVLDITTIGRPAPTAAGTFVAYVLSRAGQNELAAAGYTLLAPTAFGNRADVPASVVAELGGS